MRADEREDEDPARKAARHDHVEGAGAVGDEVGDDAAEDRGRIEDREQVEAEVRVRDAGGDRVRLDVEEGHVQAHEGHEPARDE